jgi:hypothetical protein
LQHRTRLESLNAVDVPDSVTVSIICPSVSFPRTTATSATSPMSSTYLRSKIMSGSLQPPHFVLGTWGQVSNTEHRSSSCCQHFSLQTSSMRIGKKWRIIFVVVVCVLCARADETCPDCGFDWAPGKQPQTTAFFFSTHGCTPSTDPTHFSVVWRLR